ncbi:hypothetical protein Nepgr_016901 [Nepenthes gracilis]|uniref:Beta-amyrin synthase n=1 Tax=Nepenthes gracilis TaxID=150966 RepID=A0AAD3XSX2_NEPGR|nr:hypothetical protein Nepgr_016901 [Nepenthes gracilis]
MFAFGYLEKDLMEDATMLLQELIDGFLTMVAPPPSLLGARLGFQYLVFIIGQDATQCLQNFGCFLLSFLYIQPLCMLACWVEDPNGDCFKRNLARIPDYIWAGEDGMKMQTCGSQLWDTVFAIQALLVANLNDKIGPTLKKGHNYIKNSQVKDNPSDDFKSMYRHISKGSWTFTDQDHGWQVSDCTAKSLKVSILLLELF